MLETLIENPFAEFSLLFLVVFLVATGMRLLRQPFIVGFIITGIIFSPQLLGFQQLDNVLIISAQLGVALLLFIAGLHLNPYYLKTDGRSIAFVGICQILFTALLAYGLAMALGYEKLTGIYVAIALTLSSTIITLKLLSDRKEVNQLQGRMSIGILLLQDIFVAIALVVLQALQQSDGAPILSLLLDNLALIALVVAPAIIMQRFFLPLVLPGIAKKQEHLFIFVISWLLLFATVFEIVGFSLEVGALFGGIMLATTAFADEISAKIKPLRDFFLIIFFVYLGTQIAFSNFATIVKPVIAMSLFVLVVKPLIVVVLMGIAGFRSKVGGKTALNLAHISEFSLILLALGQKIGAVNQELVAIVTLVALITIGGSTYLITYDKWIVDKLEPLLKYLEWDFFKPLEKAVRQKAPEILLIGAKRSGSAIIKALKKSRKNFLVIDFDPEVIRRLKKQKVPSLYGDLENIANIEAVSLANLVFVISTVSDLSANLSAVQFLNKNYPDVHYLCYALDDQDALQLYEKGVAYVLVPHYVGGKFISTLIESYQKSPEEFIKEKLGHLRVIDKRI